MPILVSISPTAIGGGPGGGGAVLRRTKAQVAPELPPKQEQVLTVDLGAKHRKIYDTRLARERQKVLGLLGEWRRTGFRSSGH